MTSGPRNGFPREGMHNPVFADHLRQLEESREQLNPALEYTIGGTVEQSVHVSVRASAASERSYTLNRGHRIMNGAAEKFEDQFSEVMHRPDFETLKGRAVESLNRAAEIEGPEHTQEQEL